MFCKRPNLIGVCIGFGFKTGWANLEIDFDMVKRATILKLNSDAEGKAYSGSTTTQEATPVTAKHRDFINLNY
jgi:hypothetical protein